MAQAEYTNAERGGGSGDTGRMRAAILNQINSWWAQASWHEPDKADRIHQKLNEAPERFISPNPGTPYREEASRIYGEIKDEYGLRTERDAVDEAREWEDRADRHYRQREREEPENELGGAPEPNDIPDGSTVQEPAAEPETVDDPEPEPAESITPEPEREPEPEDRHKPFIIRLAIAAPAPLRGLFVSLWVLLRYGSDANSANFGEINHV